MTEITPHSQRAEPLHWSLLQPYVPCNGKALPGIAKQKAALNGPSQLSFVPGRNQEAVAPFLDHFEACAAAIGCDDWQPEGHRLVDHKAPDVLPGRQDEDIRRGIIGCKLLLRQKGDAANPIRQAADA